MFVVYKTIMQITKLVGFGVPMKKMRVCRRRQSIFLFVILSLYMSRISCGWNALHHNFAHYLSLFTHRLSSLPSSPCCLGFGVQVVRHLGQVPSSASSTSSEQPPEPTGQQWGREGGSRSSGRIQGKGGKQKESGGWKGGGRMTLCRRKPQQHMHP